MPGPLSVPGFLLKTPSLAPQPTHCNNCITQKIYMCMPCHGKGNSGAVLRISEIQEQVHNRSHELCDLGRPSPPVSASGHFPSQRKAEGLERGYQPSCSGSDYTCERKLSADYQLGTQELGSTLLLIVAVTRNVRQTGLPYARIFRNVAATTATNRPCPASRPCNLICSPISCCRTRDCFDESSRRINLVGNATAWTGQPCACCMVLANPMAFSLQRRRGYGYVPHRNGYRI
jgi:hypothetical protein